jgi:hypothetical protein
VRPAALGRARRADWLGIRGGPPRPSGREGCGRYGALLDDRYPSTDEAQSLRLDIPYADARTDLNRWLPLVKWFLAIPHYIVPAFLGIAAVVCIVIARFAILFTGRYPRGLFDFVLGVGRWSVRVSAYAFLLTTDRYPPFSLRP